VEEFVGFFALGINLPPQLFPHFSQETALQQLALGQPHHPTSCPLFLNEWLSTECCSALTNGSATISSGRSSAHDPMLFAIRSFLLGVETFSGSLANNSDPEELLDTSVSA
jgi:hypothetical protein